MRVAVDFSHCLVMIDLRTRAKRYFLVPSGKATPVEVADETVKELFGLSESVLADVVDQPAMLRGPEPVVSVTQAPDQAPQVSLLSPGSMGAPVAPGDMFGAEEG